MPPGTLTGTWSAENAAGVWNLSPCQGIPTRMFLNGIGTATPPARYTKLECWEAFRHSEWFERLSERTRALARAVLLSENGMEARRLAVASLEEVFRIDPDTLHRRFLATAPEIATRAGASALDNAG